MSYWIAGLLTLGYLATLAILCLPRGTVAKWIHGSK